MKTNYLYIDELGNPNPSSPAHDYFILSACSVPDKTREALRARADKIIFKYWGPQADNIIFHSAEIGRRSGAFSIFRSNNSLYQQFLHDILLMLNAYPITLFVNITDNAVAYARNWDMNTVLRHATTHVAESFTLFLVGSHKKGKIITESATDVQNAFILKAFTTYLAPNAISGINFRTVQDSLTSLSVVTKNNHDIEEQIADLFAYAARCKYERDELGKIYISNSYESKIVAILERKLYKVPRSASLPKRRILSQIESFKILTN